MPDLPGDFQTLPSPVGLVKYFCAHLVRSLPNLAVESPESTRGMFSRPSWRVWLGQRDEKICSSLNDTAWLIRLCLIPCPGVLLRQVLERKQAQPIEAGLQLQPWKVEWITPGQSWCRGRPCFMTAELHVFTQIYFVDPGYNQCITNPRLLLEIKERFVKN